MMEYQLIRSRRKTLAICIDREGAVIVRAPLRAAQSVIDRFVREKQDWIREKSLQGRQRAAARRNLQIGPGTMLPLMGGEYPVRLSDRSGFDGTSILVHSDDPEQLLLQIKRTYQSVAAAYIQDRIVYYTRMTGLTPSGVRIGSANTSWGSCSGKNRLNFTWKLMMAAPEEIDYVIVHELAHIREHNHSPQFWKLVENVLPDYRERRKRLNETGKKLQNQGWG